MDFKKKMRQSVELGVGLTAVAALILAGCGGGGGSSTGGSNSGGATGTTTTITPFKGMFTSGSVTLKDANGNTVPLLSGGSIGPSGTTSITYGTSVVYPLTVSVNGTYVDEVTGIPVAMLPGQALRGVIPDANTAAAPTGVPVTAITDLAVATLPTGFSSTAAVAAITGVASAVLGVSYTQAMQPPVFDVQGKTADANTLKLAALAAVASQSGAGVNLLAKLQGMGSQMVAGSAVNAVIPQATYQNALNALNGGASSVLPAGTMPSAVPAPSLPATSLSQTIMSSLPHCGAGQMLTPATTGLQCTTPTTGAAPTGSPLANLTAEASSSGLRWAWYMPASGVTQEMGSGSIRRISAVAPYAFTFVDTNYFLMPASGVNPTAWTSAVMGVPAPTYVLSSTGTWVSNVTPTYTTNSNGTFTDVTGEVYTINETPLEGSALASHSQMRISFPAASGVTGVFPAGAKVWKISTPTGVTATDRYNVANHPSFAPPTTTGGSITSGMTLAVAQTHTLTSDPLCVNSWGLVYQGPSPTTAGAGRFSYYALTTNAGVIFPTPVDCTNSTIAAGAAAYGTVDIEQLTVNGATMLKFVNEASLTLGTNVFEFSSPSWGKSNTIIACLPAPVNLCLSGNVLLAGYNATAFYSALYNRTAMDAMLGSVGLPTF